MYNMKNIVIIAVLVIMASCNPGGNADKMSELQDLRKKVEAYNARIAELEKEVGNASTESESKSLAVEVKEIRPETFRSYFEVTGTLESLNDAFISPEINGQVNSIAVERGDRVKKNDLLLKLNTDVTEKNISEVKTSLELARKLFDKQQDLWDKQIGSEIQYLEAKNQKESLEARLTTLQAQLDMAYVKAPFDGIIDDIAIKPGELASPGARLMRLVNLNKMRISARVSEAFIGVVSAGDSVQLSFASLPDQDRMATISRVSTVIDPSTRTFAVEVLLDNKDEALKPNLLCSVRINEYVNNSAYVVPSIAMKQDFRGTFLFLADRDDFGNATARKTYITTGMTVEDKTMVTEGISENDLVIVKGFNLAGDGSKVEIVNQ